MKGMCFAILLQMLSSTLFAQLDWGISSGLFHPIRLEKSKYLKFNPSTFVSLMTNKPFHPKMGVSLTADWYLLSHSSLKPIAQDQEEFRGLNAMFLSASPYLYYTTKMGSGTWYMGLGWSGNFVIKQKEHILKRYTNSETIIDDFSVSSIDKLFSNSINVKIEYVFKKNLYLGYEFRYNFNPFPNQLNKNIGLNFLKLGFMIRNKQQGK
jgi:hypothetical protein